MAKKHLSELKPIEELMTVWDVLTPDERQFVKNNYSVHFFKKNELIHCEGETPTHMERGKSVLLLFTGGTISMSEDPQTGALRPINFEKLQEYLPELKQTGIHIKSIPLFPLIDSSDVFPPVWERMANNIQEQYEDFDGFVILHGR